MDEIEFLTKSKKGIKKENNDLYIPPKSKLEMEDIPKLESHELAEIRLYLNEIRSSVKLIITRGGAYVSVKSAINSLTKYITNEKAINYIKSWIQNPVNQYIQDITGEIAVRYGLLIERVDILERSN